MDAISTGNRCAATNRKGDPCGGWAIGESVFCFAHDPERAAERLAARAKGGHARHGRHISPIGETGEDGALSIATPEDVLNVVRQAILDALTLENSIARARTIGYLAGVAFKAFELVDIDARLSKLELATK